MNRKMKRLTLSKETVQHLEERDLQTLVGGARTNPRQCSAVDACPTRLCPSIAIAC